MMRDPTASPNGASPGPELPELLPEFDLVLPEFALLLPEFGHALGLWVGPA